MTELTLQPLQDTDIPLFTEWLDKERIYKWLCPTGEEHREAWLDEVNNRAEKYPYMKHFMVWYDERAIGFCLFMDCFFDHEYFPEHYGIAVDRAGSVFEIGYLIGEEEYLGKGLGKEIVRRLEENIVELGGVELLADPGEENIISIRTLLSNGFTKVKDGDYRKQLKRQTI